MNVFVDSAGVWRIHLTGGQAHKALSKLQGLKEQTQRLKTANAQVVGF